MTLRLIDVNMYVNLFLNPSINRKAYSPERQHFTFGCVYVVKLIIGQKRLATFQNKKRFLHTKRKYMYVKSTNQIKILVTLGDKT